jgi:serine/threonine protein kinase
VTQPAPMNPAPANAGDPAPSADANGATGEVLPRRFGKYTLMRGLAQGGMAELYLAMHRSVAGFERLVVIKRILPECRRTRGSSRCCCKEARIAATFSHPNIVTIFDVGQAEGEYFIAMEHIHGEDLRSIVRAMKPKKVTEFPMEHAIAIGTAWPRASPTRTTSKDLHGNPLQVVHRDISPQNVLVTFTGDVKVVDFGIAKAAARHATTAPSPPAPRRARSGTAPKPRERAPHEGRTAQGQDPVHVPRAGAGRGHLDARSDIFSLGIMLFELCTGRRLFRGPTRPTPCA